MSKVLTLASLASLLVLAPARIAAAEERYTLEARSYFGGGPRLEAELVIEELSSGDLQVEHRLRAPGQAWRTLRGRGRKAGRYTIVRFPAASGIEGSLGGLFNSSGSSATASDSLAYFWPAGPGQIRGLMRLRGSQQQVWLRESGTLVQPDYLSVIPDRATFDRFAKRDNVPGAMDVPEVKFLVTDVDTATPTLYFFDTNEYPFHHEFATRGLGLNISLGDFNRVTYFTQNRRFLAGSLIAHDHYEHPTEGKGIYTVEFWPTDPVRVGHVDVAYKRAVAGLPFATSASGQSKVFFHPAGDTQEQIYRDEKAQFDARRIKAIMTDDLFGSVTFSALNPGEGYGILRVIDGSDPRPASARDVVIFRTLPNDLSHVAGVITELPQTPLSHINLKAKQNDTPNAYVKGASTKPEVQALVGKLVHYVVNGAGYTLEEADPADAAAWLDAVRPKNPQVPVRDLTKRRIRNLNDLRHGDVSSVGAKAANLAELRRILPAGVVPSGFAIPFSFYDDYMKHNGFYAEARAMMADPSFKDDPAVRAQALKAFRKRIKKQGTLPPGMEAKIGAIQAAFPATQPLRCRSSTNNEDLAGFNGAGLYDSHTHRPDEGHLSNTIMQVWSKLWTFRAFEERDFYRIDHLQAAMGVLVHPNFDDEQSNGVAVTKNIYDPNWPGMYVNVQVGESLVTNPDAGATPDEFLVARLGPQGQYEVQYIQKTNQPLPQGRTTILTSAQTQELVRYMERIQDHFRNVYQAQADPGFAMDIEFKITKEGRLAIKQARPWVD